MTVSTNELEIAWAMLGQGQFSEAYTRAGALLARQPDNVSALVCHAMASWKSSGDVELALEEMRRAVGMAPDDPTIRHNLANLLASRGDMTDAVAQYEAALAIKPDDTLAFYGLTQNQKFRATTPVVAAMERLHQDGHLDPRRREFLAYGLAKVFSDLGVPDKAMAYAMEANELGARPFDLSGETQALAALRELTRQDAFRKARNSGSPDRRPLFIVGLNRSGTTLVESILSRHPQVVSRGEMSDVQAIEAQALRSRRAGPAARNAAMLAMTRDWIAAQAESLVKRRNAEVDPSIRIVTDKLPENAVRLGLIARLFPQARIIYVRRHPLDAGMSNYFQRFAHGQGFSTRLDWVGARTRQIADAMLLWKQALDLPILDVGYEALVADPEGQSRRIIDFAGLDWRPECLEPNRTQRSVLTASQWQVHQPIYTGSVDRWRRYEQWLAPMIDAMGGMAWIEGEVAAIQESVASRSTKRS